MAITSVSRPWTSAASTESSSPRAPPSPRPSSRPRGTHRIGSPPPRPPCWREAGAGGGGRQHPLPPHRAEVPLQPPQQPLDRLVHFLVRQRAIRRLEAERERQRLFRRRQRRPPVLIERPCRDDGRQRRNRRLQRRRRCVHIHNQRQVPPHGLVARHL